MVGLIKLLPITPQYIFVSRAAAAAAGSSGSSLNPGKGLNGGPDPRAHLITI